MVKKQEILKEKWFSFRRIHCTEGFIDIWTGPNTENPNNDTESEEDSLITDVYFRLNGDGDWLHRKNFDDMMYWINFKGTDSPAEEIWKLAINK